MFIMKTSTQRAQSIIEYIVLVTAVVMVFIVFLNPNGPFRRTVENLLINGTVDQINAMVNEIYY